MKSYYLLLLVALSLISCESNGKRDPSLVPKSVGNINSLQVVVDNDLWNGEVGEAIREHFAAPAYGLPQDEPMFSMNQMPVSAYAGFARKYRLVLYVALAQEQQANIVQDQYAKPQTLAILKAPTEAEVIELINQQHKKIIDAFTASEIAERQRRTRIQLLELDSLKERMGVRLEIPSAYRVARATDSFYWFRKDLKSGSTNVIVYEVPLGTIGKDTNVVGDIITMRDSIGGGYMPVEDDGRFITEAAYAPYLFTTTIDDKFAYETKGTWEVQGQYMAGPFVNYAIKDEENDRYLILEGFTYAPSEEKRNLQFELESILKSAKID
jgi:hypothetical protein